ncbi:hypothetical protein AVEN_46617-1 [Araneus ventricosus]|uniref:Uncharacterized protein n=1 Tax=Araneus ventricosus TaxID=182803 RepID=A0A4Y2VW30_ARAVE|nr:hypothetical protein AVEN_46617-1 [Araneus ventricosus]
MIICDPGFAERDSHIGISSECEESLWRLDPKQLQEPVTGSKTVTGTCYRTRPVTGQLQDLLQEETVTGQESCNSYRNLLQDPVTVSCLLDCYCPTDRIVKFLSFGSCYPVCITVILSVGH